MAKKPRVFDSTYTEALERIGACRKAGDNLLDLSGLGLRALPPEIGQLTALTTLYLSNNQLSTLPPEIGQLTALMELELYTNRLTTLPPEIGQLTALITLHLRYNQLSVLPPEIGQLTALMTLALYKNQLNTLPPEIRQFTALRTLDLEGNRLTTLPPEIGQLTALTSLELGENQLSALPPEIGQLTSLTTLEIFDNQLSTLPPEIGQLTALTRLFLHGNPSLGIPDSVLGPTLSQVINDDKTAARPQDIVNFYFGQREAAQAGQLRPVNEIKVMLVGRGGAGKTSLRRYFLNQPHDTKEKETPGIALDSFPLRNLPSQPTVRLWDFAGQEITHALHQFFLTEGCVYLLVLDPRSNTEMADADYWLGLLKRYADGAPVLVVLNRQDARQGGYDVDRRALSEQFPVIHSFIRTNCETREGCDELRQRLCEAVASLKETEPPHLQVPASWLKLMRACSKEDEGSSSPRRQHISLDEFRELCSQHNEHEADQQASLARLLHKLGVVLHFVDEPRLRDTSVLDPHWVTDGVYRLLRFHDRPDSDGVLTLEDALKALPGEEECDARFLLRLMERFEMCFPLESEQTGVPRRWLIPGALDPFQPEGVSSRWQQPGGVRLRYVYDPLPEGVLPRFIVRTHLLSEGHPRWRHGVIVAEGRAKALVRRGANRNHVEVTAFGPEEERLRLLEIVQGNLEWIHADLPGTKPYAEVELADLPGVFRRRADLEAAELGQQQLAVQTDEAKVLVNPTPQLNLTSEPGARNPERIPLRVFLSYSHKDTRTKLIFQENLTVLQQKKFITPWHDGLIEPGMRWKEEIEGNLATMDLFVGLLTTSFLASHFIQEVELKAARARLHEEDRDFLFVLVLVDDISLHELDLAEYQILKPGGKAVTQYPSRKAGFDDVQKELERLIGQRQPKQVRRRRVIGTGSRDDQKLPSTAGITVLVQGDYVAGGKSIVDDHHIHVGGSVTNSQMGQTLVNCATMIRQQAPGEFRTLLEQLQSQAEDLVTALPAQHQDEAQQVVENLEMLVKQTTSNKPNRKWYSVSAEGLLDAANYVKDFSGALASTIKNLGTTFWPDFKLPIDK